MHLGSIKIPQPVLAQNGMSRLVFSLWGLAIVLGLLGCDPERRKECEWRLVADPSRLGQTDEGLIPVCAQNRVSRKQDCRLQTTLKFAKRVEKMRFRYVDLEVEDYGLPRTIAKIGRCP